MFGSTVLTTIPRALLAVLTSALLVLGLGAVGAGPAAAAGSGVLNLTITPVDASNGNALVTDAKNGTPPGPGYASNNTVTYLVQYSCATAACDNAKVQLSPPPADPHGLLPAGQYILMYSSFVPPAGIPGATISGTDQTGKTVSLGNLPAGSSGTFSVAYKYETTLGHEIPNGSFYPDGFTIAMSADITSDTATAPKHATASDVTWHIGVPAGPTAVLQPANGTFRTGSPVTLELAVNGGNVVAPGSCLSGNADVSAVGNYQIVYHLPPQADIQSASDGGVVDDAAHTVTWTMGSDAAPVYGARGAWGLAATAGFNCGGAAPRNDGNPEHDAFWRQRTVTVTFPGSNFPEADANGCNFNTAIQSTLDVSVTYLDQARTNKTTSKTMDNHVACTDPFGGIRVNKDVPGGFGGQFAFGDGRVTADVYATNVPAPGEPNIERFWRVMVANQGNVPGVATIDEPNLALDHLKVRQVSPSGIGMTVEWTADDGHGAVTSGTATLADGQVLNAPAGGWFVSVKATTDPIAPGRILPTDTTDTPVFLTMRYGVDSGAPIGERRTNTAHVEMTYPGFPNIEDTKNPQGPLTQPVTADPSRTVQYTQISPTLTASFVGNPVVDGGGSLNAITPGTPVTWTVKASTNEVWPGTQIRPQLMYVAPVGWKVVAGSASVASGAPAGVTFDYVTRTIGGVSRDVVIATWPGLISPSTTGAEDWAAMTVKSTPSPTAPAGVATTSLAWAGDASGHWSEFTPNGFLTDEHQFRASRSAVTDTGDVDADGNTTEQFAEAPSANVQVAALPATAATKEVCKPDPTKPDGCDWTSSTGTPVQVPDNAPVKFRITLKNTGNAPVTGAVAEDVLPHTGDGRGSQFDLTVAGTSATSSGLQLDYSTSTNPGVNDWTAPASGAKAVRVRASTLAIGASLSTVVSARIPAAAADGQQVCNNLDVRSNQTLPTTTTAVCAQTFTVTPGLKLDKSATLSKDVNGNGFADAGDQISYTFAVKNTGNVAVDGVAITDPMLSAAGVAVSPPSADLAAGASTTFTAAPYTVTATDATAPAVTNTATAAGTAGGDAVTSPDDSASVRTTPDPSLALTKKATLQDGNGNGKADVGETIDYSFEVDNTGTRDVDDVTIDDPLLSGTTPASADIVAGDTATFTGSYLVTQHDVDAGSVRNVATASGTWQDGPDTKTVTSNSSSAEVETAAADPALTVDKTASFRTDANGDGKADKGDVLTYTFAVTNTGNVTLTDVAPDDPRVSGISPGPVTLSPGTTQIFTADYTVTQDDVEGGDVVNTATASGTPPSGAAVTSPPDSVTTPGATRSPSLALDKKAALHDDNGNGKADVGETVDYTVVVDNTGNLNVKDVAVSDSLLTLTPATADVAVGDKVTFTGSYTVTQADVDAGTVHNEATASGTWLDGRTPTPVASNKDSVDVATVAAVPALEITKTATLHDTVLDDDRATPGEKISYAFVVTNTGNVTVSNVTVHDPQVTGIAPASVSLAPGDSQTFTADDYTVTNNDLLKLELVNTATASGDAGRGGPVTSAPSTARVPTSVSGGGTSCDTGVDRVGGADRYETAAMLSARTYAARVPVVYVASGQAFPDALGGGVAAGHDGAPLLLVTRTSVPASTAKELRRLAPQRIVVLGQTAAVSAKVASALEGFTSGPVTRIGGADRYVTAALLAKAAYPHGVKTAYLASGEVFADALSGGPSAILAGAPMLLTRDDTVPAATLAALRSLGVTKVVVLGGTDAVSRAAAASLPGSVQRIAGADRYATSVAIAQYTFPDLAAKPACATVYLATGEQFADALTGGPVAAGVPGPVLLTPTAALATATGDEIESYLTRRAVVLGGTRAVSAQAAAQADDRLVK
jgi:uncharacterized repeat protein (TIGR01451 family)